MGSEIQVVESCFVAPSTPTPSYGLWVSSLDVMKAKGGHTPLVYFYRRPNNGAGDDFFDPSRLKEAMAKALVAFYPLAGRIGVDNDGRIEIKCNSEGALFVVARSDQLSIDDLMPFPELKGAMMFVPRVEPASVLFAAQVTFMKCGGVVLGTAFHHVAVDATGDFHFMQTWSAFSRSDGDGAAVELPCHDRTLLRARSPPVVHPDALSVLYSPTMTKATSEPSGEAIAVSIIAISDDQLASLKCACGGASTFCAVSALVWQCACAARRLAPDAEARISFSVNARRRGAMVPARLMGNGVLTVYATGAARDITASGLERAAGHIRAVINRVDDELVRSAMDHHQELVESGYRPGLAFMADAELRVVCWLGMPMYDADFGWGKPWRVSRAGSAHRGYVHLVRDGPEADGPIRVMACLDAAHAKEFERLISEKLNSGLCRAKL